MKKKVEDIIITDEHIVIGQNKIIHKNIVSVYYKREKINYKESQVLAAFIIIPVIIVLSLAYSIYEFRGEWFSIAGNLINSVFNELVVFMQRPKDKDFFITVGSVLWCFIILGLIVGYARSLIRRYYLYHLYIVNYGRSPQTIYKSSRSNVMYYVTEIKKLIKKREAS